MIGTALIGGACVVIQGPRFATRAESRFYASQGWDIINMTQYPEGFLAREMEIRYSTLCVVTDYDVGVEGEIPPVSHAEVMKKFGESIGTLRDALWLLIPKAATTPRACVCAEARGGATG